MKVLIAPDSFKESMSSMEAAIAIKKGIMSVFKDAQCVITPMADGGEGTADCLFAGNDTQNIECFAHDPLYNKISSNYLYNKNTKTAVIEIAKICGIMLVAPKDRDPMKTTSFGVGQLIKSAITKGCTEIILTLGGTVTNDGGCGMLQALGGKFTNAKGEILASNTNILPQIANMDLSKPIALLKNIKVVVLCDVQNLLLGKEGATYVFGPQKGLCGSNIELLENAMANYAQIIKTHTNKDISKFKGSGAAGGLAGGLFAICDNISMEKGANFVMRTINLEEKIKNCDIVITGEGAIDSQSLQGKVPVSIAQIAQKFNKPTYIFAGKVSGDMERYYENGITAVFCILREIGMLDDILKNGKKNLELTVQNFARSLKYSLN